MFYKIETDFSCVQNILTAPQRVWSPQNGLKDCRRLTLVVACPQPACACPEEAKLGTFGTDRGKDWGGEGCKKCQVFRGKYLTHMSRPPKTFLLTDYKFNWPIIISY